MRRFYLTSIIARIYQILPPNFRAKALITMMLLLVNSVLDLLGLGAIIPIVLVVVEENAIEKYESLGTLYSYLNFDSYTAFITVLCVGLLVVLATKSLLSILIAYMQAKFTFSLQGVLAENLYKSFYAKGLPYILKMNSAKILRNTTAVPNSFAISVILPLLGFLNEILIISAIFIGLIIYEPQVVGLLILVVGPTFGLFYYFSKNRISLYQEQLHEWAPKLAKVVFESIYGFKEVKISGTEKNFFKEHAWFKEKIIVNSTYLNTFRVVPQKVIEFSMFLGLVIIIVFGIRVYESRGELITLLGVFALSAYRVMPSINRMMVALMSVRSFDYTIKTMEKFQAWKSPDYAEQNINDTIKMEHELVVEGLSFSYADSKPVLRNVEFSLKRGEMLGIMGESGSGKSTLMNVLLGFFNPTSGHILVDKEKIDDGNLVQWQRSVGYVSQDVFMLDRTVRENVAFGVSKGEIDDNKVIRCLEMASLKATINEMEGGIYAGVGERGAKLSGGQRQRMAIARALYNDAKILFFDEATSALDNQTEREITESIQKLSQSDLTIVMIAHRVTSLKYCDRILVMNNGEIESEKAYAELLKEAS